MSKSDDLRKQRAGTVINLTSAKQEAGVGKALAAVVACLEDSHGFAFDHSTDWKLIDIVSRLRKFFPDVSFECHFNSSSMRPDGGILSILSKDEGRHYPILISEVKNQGTNDLRAREGKKKQAKGNAIERLGKNVIGFRAAMLDEGIVPFVCFGYGCDFESDSSILDRVSTIAMFGALNEVNVVNHGPNGIVNRGSFFFRAKEWTVGEMEEVMMDVAERSLHYYMAKYGRNHFRLR